MFKTNSPLPALLLGASALLTGCHASDPPPPPVEEVYFAGPQIDSVFSVAPGFAAASCRQAVRAYALVLVSFIVEPHG